MLNGNSSKSNRQKKLLISRTKRISQINRFTTNEMKQSQQSLNLNRSFSQTKIIIPQQIQQLCDPNSLNIKQVKGEIINFCQKLLMKQIIPLLKFQIFINKLAKSNKKNQNQKYRVLTQEQFTNLIKWEIIIQFLIQFIRQIKENSYHKEQNFDCNISNKLNQFQKIYQEDLEKLFSSSQIYESKNFNNEQSGFDIALNTKFKYFLFNTVACILNQIIFLQSNSKQLDMDIYKIFDKIQDKFFYFIDLGQIIQRAKLWKFLENINQPSNLKQIQLYRSSQIHQIIEQLYFGLIVEALVFQSVSSSLRFVSKLILFLINQNLSQNNQFLQNKLKQSRKKSQQFRFDFKIFFNEKRFSILFNLNKIFYFLRALKNASAATQASSKKQNSDFNSSTTSQQIRQYMNSRKSLISKQLLEQNMNNMEDVQKISYLQQEAENSYYSNIQIKIQSIIHEILSQKSSLSLIAQEITAKYEPLNQILMLKNVNFGSDYLSNASIKKNKYMNFTKEEIKLFFIFIVQQLLSLFKNYQFKIQSFYQICENHFIKVCENKKLQKQVNAIKNKQIKGEIIQKFHRSLKQKQFKVNLASNSAQGNLNNAERSHNNQSSQNKANFLLKDVPKKSSSLQKYKIIYPNSNLKNNLKLQNSLKNLSANSKLKIQCKKPDLPKLQLKTQQIKNYLPKLNQTFNIQNAINLNKNNSISKKRPKSIEIRNEQLKKIYHQNRIIQQNQNVKIQKNNGKSISLPSKINLLANRSFKNSQFSIKKYQQSKSKIFNKKFNHQMLMCQRQNQILKSQLMQNNQQQKLNKVDKNSFDINQSNQRQASNNSRFQVKKPQISRKKNSILLNKGKRLSINKNNVKDSSQNKMQTLAQNEKNSKKNINLEARSRKRISKQRLQPSPQQSNPIKINNQVKLGNQEMQNPAHNNQYQSKKQDLKVKLNSQQNNKLSIKSRYQEQKRQNNLILQRKTGNSINDSNVKNLMGQKNYKSGPNLNNQLNFSSVLISGINAIIESCKVYNNKKDISGKKLKITNQRSNSFLKKNFPKSSSFQQQQLRSSIQQQQQNWVQKSQSKIQELKYQDASQILSSLDVYFRSFLQSMKYSLLIEQKFSFYEQLKNLIESLNSAVQLDSQKLLEQTKSKNQNLFYFNSSIFSLAKFKMVKTKIPNRKQPYWNVYQFFFKFSDGFIKTVQIQQKDLLQKCLQKQELINYFKEKFKRSNGNLYNSDSHPKSLRIIGDLAGNLYLYNVKIYLIKQLKGQQNEIKNQDNLLCLSSYLRNNDVPQIVGLRKQKYSIQNIQVYITRFYQRKSQLNIVPEFVVKFYFQPMNKYAQEWNGIQYQKEYNFKSAGQQQNQHHVIKQDKKILHIYFLNRQYEKKSRFQKIIKSLQERYPSFSYKECTQSYFYTSQQQKKFSQSIVMFEFTCKNLIFNKKYVLFNIKVVQVIKQTVPQIFVIIQQKNSNFADHRLIFYVFPIYLNIKTIIPQKQHQGNLQTKNKKLDEQKFKHQNKQTTNTKKTSQSSYNNLRRSIEPLFNKIKNVHSLKQVCTLLTNSKKIKIQNWQNTMFNKLLLTDSYIKVIKKVYINSYQEPSIKNIQKQQTQKQYNYQEQDSSNSNQLNIHRGDFIFVTIKVFILQKNNLVIGILQSSLQHFFFILPFDYINDKSPRIKCKPLSKNHIDKYKNQFSYKKDSIKKSTIKRKKQQKNFFQFTINNFMNIQTQKQMNTKKSLEKGSTKKIFKSQKDLMNDEQKLTQVKQKFISLFRYQTSISLVMNENPSSQARNKRLSVDNYHSLYSMQLKVQNQSVKLMETKYYWPDLIPHSNKNCYNFRLQDDSLLSIKLKKDTYYLKKSNKIKTLYYQNYLKQVQQNRLKYKGNTMTQLIKKNDKSNYYQSYKIFIQQMDQYYLTFSPNKNLLFKIKYSLSETNSFQISVVDVQIQSLLQASDYDIEQKQKLLKLNTFQIKLEDVYPGLFIEENAINDRNQKLNSEGYKMKRKYQLNKRLLNTKKFRKRFLYLLQRKIEQIMQAW